MFVNKEYNCSLLVHASSCPLKILTDTAFHFNNVLVNDEINIIT